MPKTIQLVEDDPDILDILYYILTDAGYEVQRSQGDDAMQQIQALPPDLVLLDHRLQARWGSEICKQLKASPVTKQTPVIMVSATMHLEETARMAGADDFLKKPFDMEELLTLVARWLN